MVPSFALKSDLGNFDVTPDRDTMMVYLEKHRKPNVPHIDATDIPSWCFEPETIWFYFEAPDPEDKAMAGAKIKSRLMEQIGSFNTVSSYL